MATQRKTRPAPTEADMMEVVGYLQTKGRMKAFALKFGYGLHYDRHKATISLCPLEPRNG